MRASSHSGPENAQHTHTHARTHTHTTHTRTHTHAHTHNTHTHTHTHAQTHTHTHAQHTHTHTHAHTHTTHTHTHVGFPCFMGTFHRRNGFYTVQTVFYPLTLPLSLNLTITGDILQFTFSKNIT